MKSALKLLAIGLFVVIFKYVSSHDAYLALGETEQFIVMLLVIGLGYAEIKIINRMK